MSISKIIPLSAIVKAHLTTSRPTSCGCKQGCNDQRCGCRRANAECSSYCHRGRACINQPTDDSSELPSRATGHRRLASSQITSQPKRPRQETLPQSSALPQSSTQPQSATANEEGNQSSPPQRLRKSKERRTTERARLAQAGEI